LNTSSKIYWYGFTRQLKELYYLLLYENYISCGWDDFFTHFTGKKFSETPAYSVKIKWKGEMYLLALTINHLMEKGFLQFPQDEVISVVKIHFTSINKGDFDKYEMYQNKHSAKKLKLKLEALFPATSGYRCKTRLFYKARNKQPQKSVLEKLGIV
jgi:hypothetical protein